MIKSLKAITFSSLLYFSCSPVFALDFLQVYELAIKNDPDILAAQYEYLAVLDTRAQSRSALLPNIALDVFTQQVSQDRNSTTNNTTGNISGNFNTEGYTLSLTQSIYNHDLYLKLEQTDLSIASSTADFESQKQTLILRVAEAYFNVLAAIDNLAFAQAEQKAIGEQLEQTQQRFAVGLIAITDVKESQAQYDLSLASEILAENTLAISREALRSIIGETPNDLNPLSTSFPLLTPEPRNINSWVNTSRQNNLSLKTAQYAYDIAAKQVGISRADHYPSLNLNVNHRAIDTISDTLNSESKNTSVMLNLSIPIYSGGLTQASTRQAVAQKERSKALREKNLRSVIKQTRDSYLGVTTSIAQVNAFEQALISTQSAYEATQASFEAGSRTTVEVLAALQEQYRAERDYAQSRYNYILNILRLKQAAGILSAQDVAQINRWLKR